MALGAAGVGEDARRQEKAQKWSGRGHRSFELRFRLPPNQGRYVDFLPGPDQTRHHCEGRRFPQHAAGSARRTRRAMRRRCATPRRSADGVCDSWRPRAAGGVPTEPCRGEVSQRVLVSLERALPRVGSSPMTRSGDVARPCPFQHSCSSTWRERGCVSDRVTPPL